MYKPRLFSRLELLVPVLVGLYVVLVGSGAGAAPSSGGVILEKKKSFSASSIAPPPSDRSGSRLVDVAGLEPADSEPQRDADGPSRQECRAQ